MSAYLDPGSGSYFFQLAIGFLVGSLFLAKEGWRKMFRFLKQLFRPTSRGS